MALSAAVQNGLRPSQLIVWTDMDGAAVDLSGATLSGRIRSLTTSIVRDVTGGLTVADAAAGTFRWDYSMADVADSGEFEVQFTAAYGNSPTPAKTIVAAWAVSRSI